MSKKPDSKTKPVRGLMSVFLALIALFTVVTFTNPVVGLTGLGVVAIIMAIIIELNRQKIWDTYRKNFKKSKGILGWWSEPNKVYYKLNVYLMWPIIGLMGVGCIWIAYAYSV